MSDKTNDREPGTWTIVRGWLHKENQIAALTVRWEDPDYRSAQYVFICGPDGLVPVGHRGSYDEQDAADAKCAAMEAWNGRRSCLLSAERGEVKLTGWHQ